MTIKIYFQFDSCFLFAFRFNQSKTFTTISFRLASNAIHLLNDMGMSVSPGTMRRGKWRTSSQFDSNFKYPFISNEENLNHLIWWHRITLNSLVSHYCFMIRHRRCHQTSTTMTTTQSILILIKFLSDWYQFHRTYSILYTVDKSLFIKFIQYVCDKVCHRR